MKQLTFIFALVAGLFLTFSASAQTLGWGYNEYGSLGIGNASVQLSPFTVPLPDATGIGGGESHTLFLKPNGTIVAAGYNFYGQTGDGTTTGPRLSPVPVSNLTNVIQVTGGTFHSAALLANGQVWGWGFNGYGQAGTGTTSNTGCGCLPTPTQTFISNVVQIDAGYNHTLALKADGTVWAWGLNMYGQVGPFTEQIVNFPHQVSGLTGIIAVSAGGYHSVALKSDGTVYTWGLNSMGQIGNNSTSPGYQPTPTLNTTLANVVQIAAGDSHTIALLKDGTIRIWGSNFYGQVGNGISGGGNPPPSGGEQTTPVQTPGIANVVEIETNGNTSYVRLSDGTIKSWGSNVFGNVGNGTTSSGTGICGCLPSPVTTSAGTGNVLIGAGKTQAFALKPVIAANAGTNQIFNGDNLRLTFFSITGAGNIAYTAIDPPVVAANYSVPKGYAIQNNQPAYDIFTTTTTSGNIDVCINSVNEFDPTNFRFLKILQSDGSNLVDRTQYSIFQRRQICARVTSLSQFVIAQGLTPTANSFSVGGSVTFGLATRSSRATVYLTDAQGNVKAALINPFSYYRFDDIAAGQTVTVRVISKGSMFLPQAVNVTGNIEDLNFTAQ